jgi:EKC/KEOPS complex subunit CGI121/TPRKB
MESYALPNPAYPTELSEISLALFTDLQEAALLRERLIKASTMEGEEGLTERSTLNFAFLDAKMVCLH